MAFGFFNVVEPGLTYVGRYSYRVNSGLSTDPIDADAVQAGELLSLNASQELVRPTHGVDPLVIDAGQVILPVLVDKGRTDVQSTNAGSGAKATVLVHIGALCTTSQFATKTGGGASLLASYTVGVTLVPCLFYGSDGVTLFSGFAPAGATVAGGDTSEGALAALGANGIATLMRAPYNISGVGTTAGRGFPSSSKVIDVLITGATS